MRYTPIFEKFFLEISALFVPVSKILEFLVHVYTDIDKFRPSLHLQCFTQGYSRALHLISRQTCSSGGNPLCWKIYSQSSKLSIPGIAIPMINSASENPFLFLVQLFLEQQIYPWNNCYTWYNLFLLSGTGPRSTARTTGDSLVIVFPRFTSTSLSATSNFFRF